MHDGRLVYSTEGGRIDYCPRCGHPRHECACRQPVGRGDGVVRISRERHHRHGKVVTLVAGLPGDGTRLTELAAGLRRLCGSGGTVKEGVLEIQGDHRDRIAARLAELGYRVKLAGG